MSQTLSVPKASIAGVLLFCLLALSSLSAEEASGDSGPKFSFGLGAALGTETVSGTTYNTFGLLPDIGYGPLGVGIDLSLHFQFYQSPGGPFGFYPRAEDWYDSKLSTSQNVDKYLSRILYVRWGHKGDPLYAQIGLLPSTTLGSGFIVGGYNNGVLRPDLKYIGLELDASGELIGFPYGGFESFVGNISTFDVLGARAYLKPFGLFLPDNAFLKEVQFGLTFAADTNPYAQEPDSALKAQYGTGTAAVMGVDTLVPLYSSDLFTAVATADAVAEGKNPGGSIGVGGKAFTFLQWGLANRFLGDNFLPDYFDQGYEVNRVSKYGIYTGNVNVPGTIGWQASLGASVLGDAVTFGAVLSGPWSSQSNVLTQPQLQSYAQLKPGLLPFDAKAFYIKNGLTSFDKLVSAENALIGAKVGYTVGAVTLSVIYDLRYLTDAETASNSGNRWVSTSRIETAVKLF